MQERESATRQCTRLMRSRKNGGGVFYFVAHMCCQYIIHCYLVQVTKALLLLYFPDYKLFSTCYVEDCRRHYRLDTNICRPSYCYQTKKKLVGFNASFEILKKGLKRSLNGEEEPKCPWRKNRNSLAPFADRTEIASSSEGVLERGLLSQVDNLDKYVSALRKW